RAARFRYVKKPRGGYRVFGGRPWLSGRSTSSFPAAYASAAWLTCNARAVDNSYANTVNSYPADRAEERVMGVASSETVDGPIAILVDDDAAVRDSLEELLLSVGIDSISFSSAQEVLDAKLPDRPGCIVLDVRMPGLSGMDLQQLLVAKDILTPI